MGRRSDKEKKQSKTKAKNPTPDTDDQQSDDTGVDIPLNEKTSSKVLLREVRRYQRDCATTQIEMAKLKRTLADATNSNTENERHLPPAKRAKRMTIQSDSENDSPSDSAEKIPTDIDLDEEIHHAAQKFVLTKGLWLSDNRKVFSVTPPSTFKQESRFEKGGKAAKHLAAAQYLEILDVIPQNMTKMVSSSKFMKGFLHGMRSQRSNTSTRIRNQMAPVFITHLSCIMDSPINLLSSVDRASFKRLVGYQTGEDGRSHYSALDTPLIHEDLSEKFDLHKLFRHPLLMHIYVALIRGPAAAIAMASPGTNTVHPSVTVETLLGIRHTTPGAIAGTAILARWGLSMDSDLQKIGRHTQINYARDFEIYLELLTKGLQQKKKSILEVIRLWDDTIFPDTDSSLTGAGFEGGNGDQAVLDLALEVLEADEEEEAQPRDPAEKEVESE